MNVPDSIRRFFLGWIEAMVIAGIVIFLLRIVVIAPFRVESGAMSPTLLSGDVFLGFKLPFGVRVPGLKSQILTGRLPKKGEVVTFQWAKLEDKIVARIVGEPGDEIEMRHGEVFLNGKSLKVGNLELPPGIQGKFWKESVGGTNYDVYLDESLPLSLEHEKTLIPPGQFFVTTDSRAKVEGLVQMGLVERARIDSRAALIAISVGRRSESETYLRWDRFFRAIR
ncbi:MAG: signal peptidase I [Bdellovibrionales bacterium]|nr:signal peptidase I [Bdellovibrionales bacterium]